MGGGVRVDAVDNNLGLWGGVRVDTADNNLQLWGGGCTTRGTLDTLGLSNFRPTTVLDDNFVLS